MEVSISNEDEQLEMQLGIIELSVPDSTFYPISISSTIAAARCFRMASFFTLLAEALDMPFPEPSFRYSSNDMPLRSAAAISACNVLS